MIRAIWGADRLAANPLHFWHPNVPRAFHGYTIAHLTDIHLDGSPRSEARLDRAVDLVLEAAPDLVVCTGDYLTLLRPGAPEKLTAAFARLHAPDGIVSVMGNHDHRRGRVLTLHALAAAGVTDLNNRHITIVRGADSLHIAGVDSISRQRARLDRALADLPGDGMAILLAHEPDFADVAAAVGRFTLQLSGHTHGGQIRLPLLTEYNLPAYGRRYLQGMHYVRGLWLWVSRGIGTTGLPVRLLAPPEVTIVTLGAINLRGV